VTLIGYFFMQRFLADQSVRSNPSNPLWTRASYLRLPLNTSMNLTKNILQFVILVNKLVSSTFFSIGCIFVSSLHSDCIELYCSLYICAATIGYVINVGLCHKCRPIKLQLIHTLTATCSGCHAENQQKS